MAKMTACIIPDFFFSNRSKHLYRIGHINRLDM